MLLPAEGPKANNLCLFLCDKEYDTCITEMSKMTLEVHWFRKKIISEGTHCFFLFGLQSCFRDEKTMFTHDNCRGFTTTDGYDACPYFHAMTA
jgi:hypothetical protein